MSISADQEQLLFGDMQFERDLGEGGMGKVQLVRSRTTGERFAVKRTKFRDWAGQRNFLLELMTWYGLPRHPHLVECRFFRTLQNDQTGESEIAIFAEYVPGGSLADWIEARKLTRLDQILDVAIQFAWGLQAAHELGVVHQDVKPKNVLLTSDGFVKVADFGLAKARAMPAHAGKAAPGQSVAVGPGGCTWEYCSPEQEAQAPLTRKTDIWSWAVSVLDMFTGKPNRSIGARAHRVVLKEYLDRVPTTRGCRLCLPVWSRFSASASARTRPSAGQPWARSPTHCAVFIGANWDPITYVPSRQRRARLAVRPPSTTGELAMSSGTIRRSGWPQH